MGLERPTGRADADAQSLGDNPPRGAGRTQGGYLFGIHGSPRTPQLLALRPCEPQYCTHPFLRECPLELRHGAHDLKHQSAGRRAAVEDAPRTQECRRAQPRSARAVTAHLSGRPNWPTFPRGRTACRRRKPHPRRPAYPSVVQATASLVLMLNIAAAGVAPRRAGRQAELPDRQPVDAAKLRSPHATRLKKRIPTGKLAPQQACPKYAPVQALS